MVVCPHCGFSNTEGRTICKSCQKGLRLETEAVSTTPLESTQRSEILDQEITRQVSGGWRLQVRTETTAQLVREVSDTNGCLLLILLCLAVVPGILYAVFAKRTESLFIQIDPYGRILRTLGNAGSISTSPAAPSGPPAASGPTMVLRDAPRPSAEDRMKVLDEMRANGRLSDEEYEDRRRAILDGI